MALAVYHDEPSRSGCDVQYKIKLDQKFGRKVTFQRKFKYPDPPKLYEYKKSLFEFVARKKTLYVGDSSPSSNVQGFLLVFEILDTIIS